MNNKTNVNYPNVPYAQSDCPICDLLASGFCANITQWAPLPSIGDAGSNLGGHPIWPAGTEPFCNSSPG